MLMEIFAIVKDKTGRACLFGFLILFTAFITIHYCLINIIPIIKNVRMNTIGNIINGI
jgi:hypothetical protein